MTSRVDRPNEMVVALRGQSKIAFSSRNDNQGFGVETRMFGRQTIFPWTMEYRWGCLHHQAIYIHPVTILL